LFISEDSATIFCGSATTDTFFTPIDAGVHEAFTSTLPCPATETVRSWRVVSSARNLTTNDCTEASPRFLITRIEQFKAYKIASVIIEDVYSGAIDMYIPTVAVIEISAVASRLTGSKGIMI
jgi:hypothetical protein